VQTYMTRFGFWRTALDLHPDELRVSISSAKLVLDHLLGGDDPRPSPEETPCWMSLLDAWTEHEHALANYGAVLCSREWSHNDHKMSPEATWFAARQRDIRGYGWLYSRPAWATDVSVLTGHRQKLVNLRPEWYGPKFDMEKTG